MMAVLALDVIQPVSPQNPSLNSARHAEPVNDFFAIY
jgi:hypothetical protein